MEAPCKEVNNKQQTKYFLDDSIKYVAIVTEDKTLVTRDGEETVA